MTDAAGKPRRAGVTAERLPYLKVGALVALAIFLVDQATKLWVLHGLGLAGRGPVEILPFLDFVLVWNPGISYGLFPQETETGRLLLIAFTVVAAVAIAVWMARARNRLLAVALACVLGGALGNLVDRLVYGAVVDFVHFHAGRFSWYVFNVADAAIVVGVALLVADAFIGRERSVDRGAA